MKWVLIFVLHTSPIVDEVLGDTLKSERIYWDTEKDCELARRWAVQDIPSVMIKRSECIQMRAPLKK